MEVKELLKPAEEEDSKPGREELTPVLEVDDEASGESPDYAISTYPSLSRHHRISTPYDTETLNTSTRSLYEVDLEYQIENERRYAEGYYMPNDADEQSRLQIMHQVFLFSFDSQLTTLNLTNPTKILDIGTGTGEWAIGMGETYPGANVIGIDLSAIQPSAVPSNVDFEIWNVEEDEDWTQPRASCDLIHFRSMNGSFHNWDVVYRRTYDHLKPGGWIEILECDPDNSSFTSFWAPGSQLSSWWKAFKEALSSTGRDFTTLNLGAEKLKAVGFVEVEMKDFRIALGSGPTDPEAKSTAKLWLLAVLEGLEAQSLRLLTRNGWSADEVRKVCDTVRGELRRVALDTERTKEMNIPVKVLVGRKPVDDKGRSKEMAGEGPPFKRHKRGSTRGSREIHQDEWRSTNITI